MPTADAPARVATYRLAPLYPTGLSSFPDIAHPRPFRRTTGVIPAGPRRHCGLNRLRLLPPIQASRKRPLDQKGIILLAFFPPNGPSMRLPNHPTTHMRLAIMVRPQRSVVNSRFLPAAASRILSHPTQHGKLCVLIRRTKRATPTKDPGQRFRRGQRSEINYPEIIEVIIASPRNNRSGIIEGQSLWKPRSCRIG